LPPLMSRRIPLLLTVFSLRPPTATIFPYTTLFRSGNIKREVPSTTRFLVTSSILPLADTGVCRKVLHNIPWFRQGLFPHLFLSLANESSCHFLHTWRRDVHFLLLYHEQKTTNHQVAYLQILLVQRALPHN